VDFEEEEEEKDYRGWEGVFASALLVQLLPQRDAFSFKLRFSVFVLRAC